MYTTQREIITCSTGNTIEAYDSYMKAYSMNPSFSHDKAEMARQLYEQTEGKKLNIISL